MGTPVIVAKDLTKVYKMGEQEVCALCGVSLEIERGEVVSIMGPSGSGKSTLMNILGCLDLPSGGEYILDGENVSRLRDNQLALVRSHKVGFIFQSFNLLPRLSALDNVALPQLYHGKADHPRLHAAQMLARVGLSERAQHLPNELSGGERQRVGIARALVMNPAIILADEPTGNLDSVTSVEIMTLLSDLCRQGATILMVTHDREVAAYAHRVLHMRDGQILQD